MDIINYVENTENSEFFPTPAPLVEKMIDGIDWNYIQTILEPSAGKGDILKGIAKKVGDIGGDKSPEIDCIEIDANLRQILKYNFSEEAEDAIRDKKKSISLKYEYVEQSWVSKKYCYINEKGEKIVLPDSEQEILAHYDEELRGFFYDGIHVVHDDFLTYQAYKEYDLIIMNPPFSNGDKHLLKALDMQKHGGSIVCLLNAETIKNPYTETRKQLIKLLNKYNTSIEYIEDAFDKAERKTSVEIALIKVYIPPVDNEPSIFDKLAKANSYSEPSLEDSLELEVTDFIQAAINRYKVEIESGIELIRTYNRMKPYLMSSFDKEKDEGSIISLLYTGEHSYSSREITVNKYVKSVRRKYWQALLTNKKFIGKLTSTLQKEYSKKVRSFADYDFSEFNIRILANEINCKIKSGIEDEILKMFDTLTEKYAYCPECTQNRYLYTGWKTNKAWKIGKKSILPCSGVFNKYSNNNSFGLSSYDAYLILSDIERILNFFSGNMTAEVNLERQLRLNFDNGITKNIQCKFFDVTFYKKGTVHITYTCPELIDRFNIYAAQNRKWLPPSYGKKQYKDMTEEEKAVIDSFQGEEAYNKILALSDYYLASPTSGITQNNLLTENDK